MLFVLLSLVLGDTRVGNLPPYQWPADKNKAAVIGASGSVAWRFGSTVVNVQDFGAIPDDGINDSTAINAAIASVGSAGIPRGTRVYIPRGTYRLSSPVRINRQTILFGDGGGGDNASTILNPDKNISGIIVDGIATSTDGGEGDWSTITDIAVSYTSQTTVDWQPSHAYILGDTVRSLTTGSGTSTVAGPNWNTGVIFKATTAGTSAGSEPAWASAQEGDATIDGGVTWTAIVASGIRLRARASVEHFMVTNSPGNGVHILGDSGGSPATNVNGWKLEYGRIVTSAMSGVYVKGADANAGYATAIDIAYCGYWGINDSSFLGNTHAGHEVAECNLGAYYSPGASAVSVFTGCYSEAGQPPTSVRTPSIVIGGQHGAGFTTSITNGAVFRSQSMITPSMTFTTPQAPTGTYFSAPYTDGYPFSWGESTSGTNFYSMRIGTGSLFGGSRSWRLSQNNSDAAAILDIAGPDATLTSSNSAELGFPKGFWLGGGSAFPKFYSKATQPTSETFFLPYGSMAWNSDSIGQEGHLDGILGWQKVHQDQYASGPNYHTIRFDNYGLDNTKDVTTLQSSGTPYAIDHLNEAGRTFTNYGATGLVGLKLPNVGGAFADMRSDEFSFYVADADGMRINAYDTNKKIQWGNHPVAAYVQSTTIGSWLKVKAEFGLAVFPATYTVTEWSGVWTDSNGLVMNPVSGPASSVNTNFAMFGDTSGGVLVDSGVAVSDIMHAGITTLPTGATGALVYKDAGGTYYEQIDTLNQLVTLGKTTINGPFTVSGPTGGSSTATFKGLVSVDSGAISMGSGAGIIAVHNPSTLALAVTDQFSNIFLTVDTTTPSVTIDHAPLTVSNGWALVCSGDADISGNLNMENGSQMHWHGTSGNNVITLPTGETQGLVINDAGGQWYSHFDTQNQTFNFDVTSGYNGDVYFNTGAVHWNGAHLANILVVPNSDTDALDVKDTGGTYLEVYNTVTKGIALHGTNTNDGAASGYVGEHTSDYVAGASGPTGGSGSTFYTQTVVSHALTAGDWMVRATLCVHDTIGSNTYALIGAISETTNSLGSSVLGQSQVATGDHGTTLGVEPCVTVGPTRISIASTTTYYAVLKWIQSTAHVTQAFGGMEAWRPR